jgi:hypothetical protein
MKGQKGASMQRRSISFPPAVWARIKAIAKAKPHMTENAIVIEYLMQGLDLTGAGKVCTKNVRSP